MVRTLPEFSLEGNVILVTGALGLIGNVVSEAFAQAGASLALLDVAPETSIDQRATELAERFGRDVLGLHADVTDQPSIARSLETVVQRFDRIDTLVHLAAIDAKFDSEVDDTPETAFDAFPIDVWRRSIDVNMTGSFIVVQGVLKQMLAQGEGNVVTVASTYSLVAPDQGLYDDHAGGPVRQKPVDYVATKSFVPNFTRYIAATYGSKGIRANCIVPHGVGNDHPQWFADNFARRSPLGRMCEPDELRGPFVFLASKASSYMTGSTLVVDGGWTAW